MSMFNDARVLYKLVDPSINEDTRTDTVSSESAFSNTANLNTEPKAQGIYLEKDYFILDGTHKKLEAGDDVGWESASLSDENGVINETLTFVFANNHDSYGVTITFPNCCPAIDFNIKYYNGAVLIDTITAAGNSLTFYQNRTAVLGWDKVVLNITKVKPQQRARLWNIVFGINEEWSGNELIKLTATKTIDLTAEKVESGEVSFDLYNDGLFNIQSIKDISPDIQRRIGIEVSFKRNGVYTKFATYKTASTAVSEQGKLISFIGYDELNRLGQSYYEIGKIPSAPKSLGAWAEEVAEDCGIELEIDASLYNIYSSGYIGHVPHREALRMIAEAGNCILITDSNGITYIKPHTPTVFGEITADNLIDKTGEISNDNKVDGVVVSRHTFVLDSNAVGLAEIQGIALTGDVQEIWIDYSVFPAKAETFASSSNITIDKIASKWYAERAKIVFTGTALETGWITILGYAYGVSVTNLTAGTSGNVKNIENSLITEQSVAESVISHQWSRLNNIYKYYTDVYVDKDAELGQRASYDNNDIYITKITRKIDCDEISESIEGEDVQWTP